MKIENFPRAQELVNQIIKVRETLECLNQSNVEVLIKVAMTTLIKVDFLSDAYDELLPLSQQYVEDLKAYFEEKLEILLKELSTL